MQQLRHQSPITITNLNVLSGIAERDNGDLITYMLYKWSRDFRKPAYKAGKRAKREQPWEGSLRTRCSSTICQTFVRRANESGLYDVDSSWPTEYWVVKKTVA
ncbi:hypothetical protein T01_15492 [Trichinella spiralis]|uniref:Uncharacterized protein n=1 Tax=Trichinella spiralis TaxID=6334 RepID=A0A0V1BVK3_TRISP|nr:hypothetical protein T01_15492 [Trichinella spiralis]